MEYSGFDWDEGNLAKCRKHGVSQDEVESLFRLGLTILPDDAHSAKERRFEASDATSKGGCCSSCSRCACVAPIG